MAPIAVLVMGGILNTSMKGIELVSPKIN